MEPSFGFTRAQFLASPGSTEFHVGGCFVGNQPHPNNLPSKKEKGKSNSSRDTLSGTEIIPNGNPKRRRSFLGIPTIGDRRASTGRASSRETKIAYEGLGIGLDANYSPSNSRRPSLVETYGNENFNPSRRPSLLSVFPSNNNPSRRPSLVSVSSNTNSHLHPSPRTASLRAASPSPFSPNFSLSSSSPARSPTNDLYSPISSFAPEDFVPLPLCGAPQAAPPSYTLEDPSPRPPARERGMNPLGFREQRFDPREARTVNPHLEQLGYPVSKTGESEMEDWEWDLVNGPGGRRHDGRRGKGKK